MWQVDKTERKWFFPVRIALSARLARWFWGGTLELDDGLGRAEESIEFSRGLIIHLDMSDGTRVRREEGTGRAKRMDIRSRGARLEGNEMNIDIVAVKQDKNILETVV